MEIRQVLFTVAGLPSCEMTRKHNPKQPATISRRKTQRGSPFRRHSQGKAPEGGSSLARKTEGKEAMILAQGKLHELRKGRVGFSVVLVEMLDF